MKTRELKQRSITTLKSITDVKSIKKNDLIDLNSLDRKKVYKGFDPKRYLECRIERVNTDNPNRINKKDWFQIILTFKDNIDVSEELLIRGTRSQRFTYKKF